jgi:hypothetical protein
MSLSPDRFNAWFSTFEHSAFRLQLLPHYDVPSEREEFVRFCAGAPVPDRSAVPWLDTIRRQVGQGRTWTTVHVVPSPMTPYFRYLLDWWLVFQAQAGATVMFLDANHGAPLRDLAAKDFWLFDDSHLVLLDYDSSGLFLGATNATSADALAAARRAREFALANAVDLPTFLATFCGRRLR